MTAKQLERALNAYKANNLEAARDIIGPAPRDGALLALLGNIQLKLGDKRAAADAFLEAASRTPASRPVLLKHAVTLYAQLGLHEPVLAHGAHASDLNPSDPGLALAVARILIASGGKSLAGDIARLLLRLDYADPQQVFLAVNHFRVAGAYADMTEALRRARAARPNDPAMENLSFTMAFDSLDLDSIERHLALMARVDTDPFAAAVLNTEQAFARLMWNDDERLMAAPTLDSQKLALVKPQLGFRRRAIRPEGDKLRIGYLSNDFSGHATMTLFLDSLLAHDRDRFDITLFCYTPQAQAAEQEKLPALLRQEFVHVRDLSDAEIAAEISRRGIDILVDLKGHTHGARLGVVNLSDAPVKVTYLGFPGPVAGVDLDYAIVDAIVAPPGAEGFYNEKLCRLPNSYQANSAASRPKVRPTTRAAHGLPEDAFIFASFNGVHKIMPASLDLWSRVLLAVPESLFWVMCPDAFQQKNLVAAMTRRGVDAARLIFAKKIDYPDHVSRLPLADLALDSFPCNGHTTTSDMLWAGLPVLTRPGRTFAARVSESLLRALDLPELIARDDDDLVARAAAYAGDRNALDALRGRLKTNLHKAPLYDSARFTRILESAFQIMAARARQSLPPEHISPIEVM